MYYAPPMDTSTVAMIAVGIIVVPLVAYGAWTEAGMIMRTDANLKKLAADKQAAAIPPQTPDAPSAQTPAATQAPPPTPPANAATPVANANSPDTNTNSPKANTAIPAESALDAYLAQWAKKDSK